MKKLLLPAAALVLAAFAALPLLRAADHHDKPKRTPSPKGAVSYIVSPADGATVKRKFKVIFGLTGMGICPAGILAADGKPLPDTGHHHLLVDVDQLPPFDTHLAPDQPTRIMHFGKGQTEAMLDAATRLRRPRARPARPAGDLEEDHGERRGVSSGNPSPFAQRGEKVAALSTVALAKVEGRMRGAVTCAN
jgi:hypothetical protein